MKLVKLTQNFNKFMKSTLKFLVEVPTFADGKKTKPQHLNSEPNK